MRGNLKTKRTPEQEMTDRDCMYIVVSAEGGYGDLETHYCNSKLKKYPQNVYPNDGMSPCVVFKRLSKSEHAQLAELGQAKREQLKALRKAAEKKLSKSELSALAQYYGS